MILFDPNGHLISTVSADELHRFALSIGLQSSWYQTPGISKKTGKVHDKGPEYAAHYDLTTPRMMLRAARGGAVMVRPREIIKRAWWSWAKPPSPGRRSRHTPDLYREPSRSVLTNLFLGFFF
ncbi:hypothetical protein ES703_96691 [subsurface metagenome]